MNSAVRPNFKGFFAEFHTCGSREQCTGPTIFQQNAETHVQHAFQTHTNLNFLWLKLVLSTCLPGFGFLVLHMETKSRV